MPRYYFKCQCGSSTAVLRPAVKRNEPQTCGSCAGQMERDPRGATSRIVETRDNGLMSRAVEQPADVERLNWERSHLPEDREP